MIATSSLLKASGSFEMAAGLALMSFPKAAMRLLLGMEPRGVGVAATRVAGLGLLSLGLACLPRTRARHRRARARAVRALLGYNALAAACLSFVRASGRHRGIALIPAIIVHAAFTGLFARRGRARS